MVSAVAIRRIDGAPGEVYYPLSTISLPEPTPKANEVVVRISAAALNHRDLFIRQHLYPKIGFNIPLLADGCGIVISTGSSSKAQRLLQERVILVPGVGWDESPYGPEDIDKYLIRGGTRSGPTGTLSEMVCVDADEVVLAPKHLSDEEAAALPLAGLTAWRAVYVKALDVVRPGNNILVTGIGGGVALMVLMLAQASGANVYVTSGKEEKLQRAEQLGASGGVNYRDALWDAKLLKMLPAERKWMDAVIDGAGGNLGEKAVNILRVGALAADSPRALCQIDQCHFSCNKYTYLLTW